MDHDTIENTLMPNTYVKLLTQEFDDLAQVASGTGIAPQELAEYPHPITVRQHLRCIENVIPLRRSPDWHLQWGKRMAENFHGVVTLAWLTAPTLGAGLDAFIRYMPSRVPYLDWHGAFDGESFRCEVNPNLDLGPVGHMLTEVPLLVMHEYVRVIRHGSAEQARIELSYAPPEPRYAYADWFDCPVEFERTSNALIVPRAWRDVRNVDFDESTWRSSLARCDAIGQPGGERDVLTQLQHLLSEALERPGGDARPNLDTIAGQLHLSPRTVIRRLRMMNTTFRQVCDEVLMQRSGELLCDPQNRVQDVAARLGYADNASFRKAFKRWYRMTPAAYRQRHLPLKQTSDCLERDRS